ncbi:MAG: hypothetical protein RMH84_05440 [Sulfolobales archaeon]|nr:hypothetical protein [Sulfolobales archaeon]MCX8208071.1 hypothetical protein [Sulfolobales archaeon]MDW8011019.1 hypothetical protein [Sulfolobales archaeon]
MSFEDEVLKIIKESTKKSGGIVQSELWKILGIDSREGSKLVARLMRKGLLTRETVMYKGKKTYILRYADSTKIPLSISVSLNPVVEIPCFTCRQISRCSIGGYYDPTRCTLLTKYLISYSKPVIR